MDFDIRALIEAAATTGGHIRSILNDVKALNTLAKGRKTDAEIVEKITAINLHVSDAHMQNASLKAELVKLETHFMALQSKLDAKEEIKKRKGKYVLSETPAGERIYRHKPEAETDDVPHEVCPACFERDQIAILQPRGAILECDICKAKFRVKERSMGIGAIAIEPDPY